MTTDSLSVIDWRRLPADVVSPLVTAEKAAWRAELDWDVERAWSAIEPARAEGRLPGAVVFDAAGAPAGWTCFLRHRDALQVAMIVAGSAAATRQLVEAIVASPEAAGTALHVVFAREAAPGLAAALSAWGFGVAGYRYRSRSTSGVLPTEVPRLRGWVDDDHVGVARLCGRAYDAASGLRAFAPRGTPDEWVDYIGTLVGGTACGLLMPDATLIVPGVRRDEIEAAVITTSLGHGVAHIAQIAVDPQARRHGLGRALLDTAIARARETGHTTVTLLVADRNAAAGALYDACGFDDRGKFLAAVRDQPRRSTSVALDTGGESTRR